MGCKKPVKAEEEEGHDEGNVDCTQLRRRTVTLQRSEICQVRVGWDCGSSGETRNT